MGTAAVARASAWSNFISKDMSFTYSSASASQSQLEEGGGRRSVGRSYGPVGQEILYLLFATSWIGIHWHRPGHSNPTAHPVAKSDKISQRYYNIPVRSRMAIPNDHERDNDNNDKDEKFEGGNIFVEDGGKPNKPKNNRK